MFMRAHVYDVALGLWQVGQPCTIPFFQQHLYKLVLNTIFD